MAAEPGASGLVLGAEARSPCRPRAASTGARSLLGRLTGRLACVLVLMGAGTAQVRQAQSKEPAESPYPYEVVPLDAIRGHLMEGHFLEPTGVCFDAQNDELYVVDSKNALIGVFTPDGVPVFAFGGHKLLQDPVHVEVGQDGRIYVQDAEQHQLKVFSYRGEPEEPLVFTYPEMDGVAAGVVRVATFTLDKDGRIYVGDLDLPQLLVYDARHELVVVIRNRKAGASFQQIAGIAVAQNGLIAVTDFKATPVQIFDREGRFVTGFGSRELGHENFTAPTGIAFDRDGFLYVVDMLRHDVKVFDSQGHLLHLFGGWILSGQRGRAPGEFLYPTAIAISPANVVFVAERFGNRVQILARRPEQKRR